jgi:SagB-type dehydrogenase family enzyme
MTSDRAHSWTPLTTIRPNFDYGSGGGDVELVNAFTKTRYTLSRQTAQALIWETEEVGRAGRVVDFFTREGLLDGEGLSQTTARGLHHWLERGWDPSVEFYLWTRDLDFIDQPSGDNFEEVRDQLLATLDAQTGVSRPEPRACVDPIEPGPPAPLPVDPLGEVLKRRMSNPKPRSRPLKEALLCSLLWHGLAPIRYPGDDLESYDALINLGRLYEIFFIAHDVRGLAPGAYYYDTNRHEFELVRLGALRAETELSIIGQHHARTAACTFVVAADFRLTQWQYRHNRTLRAFYVDAGKIVQHLILIATAHRLSTAMSAAINDSKICELLKMDPENEQAFFTLSVG